MSQQLLLPPVTCNS